MAGKAQKPIGQLQEKKNPRAKSGVVTLMPDQRRKVPRCPKTITGMGRVVYNALMADPVSQVLTGADMYDVHRYCHLIERRESLEREAWAQPVVESEYGASPNPRFRIVKELSREIEKLREQLGVLPLARMRLGISIGQASESLDGLRKRLTAPPPKRADVAPGEDGIIDLDGLA